MKILYNFFIYIYYFGIRIAALRNEKAKSWVAGRRQVFKELEEKNFEKNNIIWVHSASAGEFEQAKPVIEALKANFPEHKIWVSFFSSSGYKVAQKYKLADHIFYLPLDTAYNAQRVLKKLKPQLVIFVKYDFWYHHLKAIKESNIPLLLVSSIFRKEQIFFKWYGQFFLKMLHYFSWIFVQNESSIELLNKHHITKASVGGDTRFDRVVKIAAESKEIPFIKEFVNDHPVIVAGSTWPDDDALLSEIATKGFKKVKLIIATHEIGKDKIDDLIKTLPNAIRYSEVNNETLLSAYKVLVIDNIGMLSRLYQYATLTYIGGGFTKSGIHNTLEAAVWGKPVIFGPNYNKFKEAKDLILAGGAFSISTVSALEAVIINLLQHPENYKEAAGASSNYIHQQKGATQKIIQFIYENRLLTKE